MTIFRGKTTSDAFRGAVVSIGNFDGVHRGHRSMIAALTTRARSAGARSLVFTFDPHPIALLRPRESPPPLSTTARKLELIEAAGVDGVLVYPTDQALLHLTPREFFDQIIVGQLAARGLVEGPNFFFGHDRAGSIETLRDFCAQAGLTLDVVPPLVDGNRMVSSTEIRRLIVAGRVREAGELLGAPYRLEGHVVTGARRGTALGFPTANLERIQTILPGDGVYSGRIRVGDEWHAAAILVGSNPTFGVGARKVEAHILDFKGDLYGTDVTVELIERLRDVVAFPGVDALCAQLAKDVAQVRALAASHAAG